MSRTQNTNRDGFTLLELLVVMAILIALMALIIPGMMNRQTQSNIRQATIQINNLDNNLVLYMNDNRGFPTTEQGLMALIYIPDNAGLGRSSLMQQQGVQPGVPGDMGTGAFGGGDATMVGDTTNPMAPMPGVGGQPDPMGGMGGGLTGTPDPMGGGMGGGLTGAPDPMGGMGGGATGFDPMNPGAATGTMSGWTEPVYNPAIYTQVRKRPQPYVEKESDLIDPWGTPYRYENNLQFSGLNRTGTSKPAIWSAGPDKLDHTDDDIPNWDKEEAPRLIAARQQQLQGGGMGSTMGNPMDPMNPVDPMNPGPMDGGMNPMPTPQPGPMPMPTTPQPGPMPMPTTPQPGPMPMPTTPQPGPTPMPTIPPTTP